MEQLNRLQSGTTNALSPFKTKGLQEQNVEGNPHEGSKTSTMSRGTSGTDTRQQRRRWQRKIIDEGSGTQRDLTLTQLSLSLSLRIRSRLDLVERGTMISG